MRDAVRFRWRWWGRWVMANAFAELVGLGGSALLWVATFLQDGDRGGVILSALLVVVGATVLEGSAVGVAQWWVLRERLPRLRLASWWIATAVGACVAWTLGMIPSTMMDLAAAGAETAATAPEISDALQLALAAAMGLVLGPILAVAQWWVLRRHVSRAGWWIPANALAWAVGMPVIFAGVGLAATASSTVGAVIAAALSLLAAGALVGAIHGAFLLRVIFPHQSVAARTDASDDGGATFLPWIGASDDGGREQSDGGDSGGDGGGGE